jgi:isoleucyl-tRNA synthetase
VPLPLFLHKETGELHPETPALLDKAAGIVEAGGVEAWSRLSADDVLGADGAHYTKSSDILEVWFDSGSTFEHVLKGSHAGLAHESGPEADIYLEGHDQHRGWFHSALLLGCALHGRAPYKALLTHGFTVDGQGKKMSKSVGNTLAPQLVADKMGAEIIRLWVASTDYSGDLAIDDKILARVVDAYRRIRNTLRFLLANVSDFDAQADAVPVDQLFEVDRYALARAAELQTEILAHYEVYEFHPVVAKLQNYCSEDLGAFYLDVLKDRLYTTAPKSLARRSAQTALWQISQAMLRWMAPFLSFTAEEAWPLLNPGTGSVFCARFWDFAAPDATLIAKWDRLLAVRAEVNKALETVRGQGLIGASLQAELRLTAAGDDLAALQSLGDDLRFVLIVSKVSLTAADAMGIEVLASSAAKCERCWHYRADVGRNPAHPAICGRCDDNLNGAGEAREFA